MVLSRGAYTNKVAVRSSGGPSLCQVVFQSYCYYWKAWAGYGNMAVVMQTLHVILLLFLVSGAFFQHPFSFRLSRNRDCDGGGVLGFDPRTGFPFRLLVTKTTDVYVAFLSQGKQYSWVDI